MIIERVSAQQDPSEYYAISWQDNGIRFEKEYENRIFDVFQRLHPNQISGNWNGYLQENYGESFRFYCRRFGIREGSEINKLFPKRRNNLLGK